MRHNTMHLLPATSGNTLTDTEKLSRVKDKLEALILNRMQLLHAEAITISSDMGALASRLEKGGSGAFIEDLRTARWYRTASEMRVLTEVRSYLLALRGEADLALEMPEDEIEPEPGDGDGS